MKGFKVYVVLCMIKHIQKNNFIFFNIYINVNITRISTMILTRLRSFFRAEHLEIASWFVGKYTIHLNRIIYQFQSLQAFLFRCDGKRHLKKNLKLSTRHISQKDLELITEEIFPLLLSMRLQMLRGQSTT